MNILGTIYYDTYTDFDRSGLRGARIHSFIHTPIHQCLMGVFPVASYFRTLFMTNLSACSSSDDLLVKYSLLGRRTYWPL